jgi:hypothetical protein
VIADQRAPLRGECARGLTGNPAGY